MEKESTEDTVSWSKEQKQEVDKMLVELRYKERLRQMKMRRAGPPPKKKATCECGKTKCKSTHKETEDKTTFSVSGTGTEFEEIKIHLDD